MSDFDNIKNTNLLIGLINGWDIDAGDEQKQNWLIRVYINETHNGETLPLALWLQKLLVKAIDRLYEEEF